MNEPTTPPLPVHDWIHSQSTQTILLLGFIFLIVFGTLITTLYTTTRTLPIVDEKQGVARLELLMQLLQLHFGTSWPYAFLGFAVVLLLFALAIFWKSRNEAASAIQIDSSIASRGLIVMVCIFILLSVGLITLFVQTFLQIPPNDFMTQAEMEEQQGIKYNILYGFAAGLVLLFGGTLFAGFFRRKMT